MNIWVDDLIFRLNPHGGIARLWRELAPQLKHTLTDCAFDTERRPDLFISTYYMRAPAGAKSLVLVYDMIMERYPLLGRDNPDAIAKRAAIQNATAVVAISEWVAADVERHCNRSAAVAYCGGEERFQRALPNEVNAFQQKYGIDRPYVMMVGKRGLYKNARVLYQAWHGFVAAEGHLVLAVGGEPPSSDDRQFAAQHAWMQLDLPDSDLAAAYSGATALVYPSYYEGFGLPVLEAMTCGCPVVCGDGGSFTEITGDAAFVCDVTRPQSVAQALNATLVPSTRFHRVHTGMKRAKTFTWARMAEQIAEVVRTVA